MKRITILFLAAAMLVSCGKHDRDFLRADGTNIVNGNGENVLLRGIGLGGWMLQEPYMLKLSGVTVAQYDIRNRIRELVGEERMDEFYEAWLANMVTKRDIDSLKAWGFNSVRLPMHYNLFTLPVGDEPVEGENTWIEKGFTMTDNLLAWRLDECCHA